MVIHRAVRWLVVVSATVVAGFAASPVRAAPPIASFPSPSVDLFAPTMADDPGQVATAAGVTFAWVTDEQGSYDAIWVFPTSQRPQSGLQDPAAELDYTAIQPVLATSGTTVVAASDGYAVVYTEPAGGWSGSIEPSARLAIPAGEEVTSLATSGDVIVMGTPLSVLIYVEPTNGWGGTVEPTKALPGTAESAVSISGQTIVVGGSFLGSSIIGGPLGFVYSEPAGGWEALRAASATLLGNGNVPRALATIYNQPASGWSGVVPASAYLLSNAESGSGGPDEVASGTPVVRLAPASPPIPAVLEAFRERPGGWHGDISAPALSAAQANAGLTTDGTSIYLGDQPINTSAPDSADFESEGTIGVLPIPTTVTEDVRPLTPTRSPISAASLTALNGDRPRLTITIAPIMINVEVKQLTIALPAGLSWSASRIAGGLRIDGHRTSGAEIKRLSSRILTWTSVPAANLTFAAPSLAITEQLRRRINAIEAYDRNPAHPHKQVIHLRTTIRATYSDGEPSASRTLTTTIR